MLHGKTLKCTVIFMIDAFAKVVQVIFLDHFVESSILIFEMFSFVVFLIVCLFVGHFANMHIKLTNHIEKV